MTGLQMPLLTSDRRGIGPGGRLGAFTRRDRTFPLGRSGSGKPGQAVARTAAYCVRVDESGATEVYVGRSASGQAAVATVGGTQPRCKAVVEKFSSRQTVK